MQVSPASTAVGLTKLVPGAEKGEPDKFYPSGERSFARVVPGRRRAGIGRRGAGRAGSAPRTVFLLGDQAVEGDGLRRAVPRRAPTRPGCDVVGQDRMDPRADDYRDLADEVAKTQPGRGLLRRRRRQQRGAALA